MPMRNRGWRENLPAMLVVGLGMLLIAGLATGALWFWNRRARLRAATAAKPSVDVDARENGLHLDEH